MTQEEKAKRYDGALHAAKAWHNTFINTKKDKNLKQLLEMIFPELAESEDEKIRNQIINFIEEYGNPIHCEWRKDWITWLEKQGKQPKKVSIWKHWKDGIAGGAEGEQIFLTKIGRIYSISSCLGYECDYIELSELDSLLRDKQAPKPKWSEEDEAHLHSITTHLGQWIERHPNTCGADIQCENLAWLESLKQRMEEQQ